MLAIQAGMDPDDFRLQNMRRTASAPAVSGRVTPACSRPRSRRRATSRTSRARKVKSGNVEDGWGVAIGTHNDSYAASVAYVTVDKSTGKVTVNHLWAAQDSGFAINPDLLMNQMSGSLIQGVSRLLHEELQFSKQRVTSRDWVSYPILRFKDAPKVTTVLINRPTAMRRAPVSRRSCRSARRSRTRSSTRRASA